MVKQNLTVVLANRKYGQNNIIANVAKIRFDNEKVSSVNFERENGIEM